MCSTNYARKLQTHILAPVAPVGCAWEGKSHMIPPEKQIPSEVATMLWVCGLTAYDSFRFGDGIGTGSTG